MKKLILTALSISSLVTVSAAFADETFTGELALESGSALQLYDSKGMIRAVHPGSAQFTLDRKGVLFSSDWVIRTAQGEFKFKIPKAAFTDDSSALAPATENEQPVTIRGSFAEQKPIRDWRETGTRSCTYLGPCVQPGFGIGIGVGIGVGHDGYPRHSHRHLHRDLLASPFYNGPACQGVEDVVLQKTQLEKTYVLELLDPLSGARVATFKAKPVSATEARVERVTSECHPGGYRNEPVILGALTKPGECMRGETFCNQGTGEQVAALTRPGECSGREVLCASGEKRIQENLTSAESIFMEPIRSASAR